MSMIAAVIGRLLLALYFIISGLEKIFDPEEYSALFTSTNLSASFVQPVGIFEAVLGALLAVGLMTRLVSVVLALATLCAIFFFYNQFADPIEGPLALRNMAIIGGLLMTFAYGQMRGSYDHMRAARRAQQAELRAARAEGRVEGVTTGHTTTLRH
jgi:putative oxidoreductase